MHDHDDDDGRIDALVRSASLRPVNEARLAASVLARVRQDRRPATGNWAALFALPRFAGPGRFAPAGFALVLLATPIAVAQYPSDDTEALIAALALGETLLLDGGVLQ